MNFSYIKQVLVKQLKFPPFLAQYILNFLWFEEITFWQRFKNVMVNLIKKPQITLIVTMQHQESRQRVCGV